MFPKTPLTTCNTLIKPLFDYCDVVRGNLKKILTARLQNLENRPARIITRKDYDERSADIRKGLRWDAKCFFFSDIFQVNRYVRSCKQQSSRVSH